MTDTTRQDRALNVMGVVTLVVVLSTLLVAVVTVLDQFGQGDTLDAQARSDELAGCRSEYGADVTAAQQDVDDAESARDDLVFLGLAALASDNDDGLAPVVDQAGAVVMDISDARAERDRVTDRRDAAVTLSRRDPAKFLERCEDDFG